MFRRLAEAAKSKHQLHSLVHFHRTLAERGLCLMIDTGRENYDRAYFDPLGRDLEVFELKRAALAEVVGGL